MKKILLFCLCLFVFPITSNAIKFCTTEQELSEREYLDNVDVSYSISINNNIPSYTVTLKNLTSSMIINSDDTGVVRSTAFKNGRYSFKIKNGKSMRITLYSKACKLTSSEDPFINSYKDIMVPSYNKYYTREECKDFQSNYICQKWSEYSGNEATFKNDIKKLKELQEKKNNNTPDETVKVKKKWYQVMREVVSKFWWAFTLLIFAIIGIYYIIWSKNKKNQFDFKV